MPLPTSSPLFPYTTLFRSRAVEVGGITGRGLVRQLAPRADHHGFDLTAAALPNRRGSTAGSASLVVLIKGDNQQAVAPRLKIAARQEWADFGLQPGVERADRAVMGVIAAVRRQPGKIRQRIIGQVRGELAEANKIRRVNVRKVLERIVADEIGAALQASTAADVRVALRVVFPGFARLLHLVGDVVNRQRQTGGGSAIVVSGNHAAGQVQVCRWRLTTSPTRWSRRAKP